MCTYLLVKNMCHKLAMLRNEFIFTKGLIILLISKNVEQRKSIKNKIHNVNTINVFVGTSPVLGIKCMLI